MGGELCQPRSDPGGCPEPGHIVQGDQLTTRLAAPPGLGGGAQRQVDRCWDLAASSGHPGVDRPGPGVEQPHRRPGQRIRLVESGLGASQVPGQRGHPGQGVKPDPGDGALVGVQPGRASE